VSFLSSHKQVRSTSKGGVEIRLVICDECKRLSGIEVEIKKLSIFGNRDSYLVDVDTEGNIGERHLHFFDYEKFTFDNYESNAEVSKKSENTKRRDLINAGKTK